MTPGKNLYVQDRRYGQKKRSSRNPKGPLVTVTLILVLLTIAVALYRFLPDLFSDTTGKTTQKTGKPGNSTTGTQNPAAPTTTPTPTPLPEYVNQQLLPATDLTVQKIGAPAAGCSPAERGITSDVFDTQYKILTSFNRPNAVSLLNPIFYSKIAGVLTFRGNNFRNAPAFGLVDLTEKKSGMIQSAACLHRPGAFPGPAPVGPGSRCSSNGATKSAN
jgi:hypothetical protein